MAGLRSWHGATRKGGQRPRTPAQAVGDPSVRPWAPDPCKNTLPAWFSLPRHASLPIFPCTMGCFVLLGRGNVRPRPGELGESRKPLLPSGGLLPLCRAGRDTLHPSLPLDQGKARATNQQKKLAKKAMKPSAKNKQRGHLGKDAIGKTSWKLPCLTAGAGSSLE